MSDARPGGAADHGPDGSPGTGPGSPPAAAIPPALRLEGVSLPFGPQGPVGLRELSLEVAPGERLVLVGASGVGKSTLLRAVAGLHPVSAGTLEIGGRRVAGPGAAQVPPHARGAVYLHQVPLLFPHLSVLDNVAFPLRIRGVGRGEREARARELLDAVRLEGLAHRSPDALSGGQRHRVALARAVAARPPLLLLDEPLSSLDPSLRHEVRDAIVALQESSGAGLLLVTHDLDEAGALAHRIGILVPGHLAQLDPPARLFAEPASLEVSRFLGYRNELPVRWDPAQGGWHHPAWGVVAGSAGVVSGEGRQRATGNLAVAVLPPGAVRAAPASAGSEVGEGQFGTTRRARVLAVHHPGPRPVVKVSLLPRPDPAHPQLTVDLEPGFLPSAGDEVVLRIDEERIRVFATDDT
jgi:ABC-type sugar transport system ATPase subunit